MEKKAVVSNSQKADLDSNLEVICHGTKSPDGGLLRMKTFCTRAALGNNEGIGCQGDIKGGAPDERLGWAVRRPAVSFAEGAVWWC